MLEMGILKFRENFMFFFLHWAFLCLCVETAYEGKAELYPSGDEKFHLCPAAGQSRLCCLTSPSREQYCAEYGSYAGHHQASDYRRRERAHRYPRLRVLPPAIPNPWPPLNVWSLRRGRDAHTRSRTGHR